MDWYYTNLDPKSPLRGNPFLEENIAGIRFYLIDCVVAMMNGSSKRDIKRMILEVSNEELVDQFNVALDTRKLFQCERQRGDDSPVWTVRVAKSSHTIISTPDDLYDGFIIAHQEYRTLIGTDPTATQLQDYIETAFSMDGEIKDTWKIGFGYALAGIYRQGNYLEDPNTHVISRKAT